MNNACFYQFVVFVSVRCILIRFFSNCSTLSTMQEFAIILVKAALCNFLVTTLRIQRMVVQYELYMFLEIFSFQSKPIYTKSKSNYDIATMNCE